MSESLEGVSVAATRQNSGSVLYGLAPLPPPCRSPGAANWPAATTCALVIVPSFSFSDVRLSHVDAAHAGAAANAVRTHRTNVARIFMTPPQTRGVYVQIRPRRLMA